MAATTRAAEKAKAAAELRSTDLQAKLGTLSAERDLAARRCAEAQAALASEQKARAVDGAAAAAATEAASAALAALGAAERKNKQVKNIYTRTPQPSVYGFLK